MEPIILRYFKYDHLPDNLQEISKPFCELARHMYSLTSMDQGEITECLRKLIEAKDCAVRGMMPFGE